MREREGLRPRVINGGTVDLAIRRARVKEAVGNRVRSVRPGVIEERRRRLGISSQFSRDRK